MVNSFTLSTLLVLGFIKDISYGYSLTLPNVFVLGFIKDISYGQQLHTAHLIGAGVHNEHATGTEDLEVKSAVNFKQIAADVLQGLAF